MTTEQPETKPVSSKYKLAERCLIRLVQQGQWRIDPEGRIWQVRLWTGRVLAVPRRAERPHPAGYLTVRAMIDGRRVVGMAHRLVWQHHHGDIQPGIEINHENGWKADNRPQNLNEQTPSGNTKHAYRTGLKDEHGEFNPAARLTDHQVVQIRLAYAQGGYTMEALAGRFGVRFQHISRIVRGQRRARQLGPVHARDLRHAGGAREPRTGRFLPTAPPSNLPEKSEAGGKSAADPAGGGPAGGGTIGAVLAALAPGRPLNRAELAQATGRTESAVSTCLTKLRARGLAQVEDGYWTLVANGDHPTGLESEVTRGG